MAFIASQSELRSFRRRPSPAQESRRRKPLQEAVRGELIELEHQLDRFSEVEAAIRLRALSELETSLSTDALCGLAARAC